LSLAGSLACLGAILAIDLTAGVIAIAVLFAIYQYLKRTAGPARWADSRRSYHLQRIREHLLSASKEPEHPRDWRPQLLVFSDDPHRRKQLLQFAGWFEGDSGFVTAVRILEGEGLKMLKARSDAEEALRRDIADQNLDAFPLVVVAPDLTQGIHTLVQSYGIGPLHANTILLNWFDQIPETERSYREVLYGHRLRTAFRLGCNIVILDAGQDDLENLTARPSKDRRIDVWWWDDASSHLMLLLAYLMTRSDAWEEAKIRVLAVGFHQTSDMTIENLRQKLDEVRIDADPEIIMAADANVIEGYSSDADLAFLPFRLRGNQPLDPFGDPLDRILSRLPMTVLVLAAEDVNLDAEPEEGKAAEIAGALDALTDAEKHARDAEKDAVKATEAAKAAKEKLQQKNEDAADSSAEESKFADIKAAADEAEKQAEKAVRRLAKAKAKAEAALQTVEALGAKPTKADEEPERTSDSEKSK
jgi:hypothetical protein